MDLISSLARLYGPEVAGDPLIIAFFASSAFAFGAVIGSFLNVCVSRLPAMSLASQYKTGDEKLRAEIIASLSEDENAGREMIEEIVRENVNLAKPRSRCPECKNTIAWYDNIPIASWILLRARCRHCGLAISPVYPLVEFVTGIALAYLLVRFGFVAGPIYFLIFCAMIVVTGVDLAIFEIPDEIVIPGIPLGILASLVLPTGLTDSLIGVAVGGGIPYLVGKGYFLLTKREGMGFGDVKLLAMLGAFFGWKGVVAVLLVASFVGSVLGLSLVLFRKRKIRALIPFGPFIAIGALVYMFAGPQLVAWYAGLFNL